MKQADRTKVCWNCKADAGCDATYCPFCGTDLLTSSIEKENLPTKDDHKFSNQTLQESLASLYKPPYSVRNQHGFGIPDERQETSYIDIETKKEEPLFEEYEKQDTQKGSVLKEKERQNTQEREEEVKRGAVFPLLFLMIGTHFLLLGTLLLFCSKNGKVTLEWNNRFWFLYCFISIPLLYFGGKKLKNQPF